MEGYRLELYLCFAFPVAELWFGNTAGGVHEKPPQRQRGGVTYVSDRSMGAPRGGARARDRLCGYGRGGLPTGDVVRLLAERLGAGGVGAVTPPRRRAAALPHRNRP